MDKKYSRRRVLHGAGGFTLALPWLPSLAVPGEALAQARRPKRFVAYGTTHGGLLGSAMFPAPAMANTTANLFAGHDGRWGMLQRTVNGTIASVSPTLSGPSNRLTERLVGKMNVYRGFDIPFYIAHNTGSHLGNYARNDGNGSDGQTAQRDPRPTIDQLMGWSSSFYGNAAGIRERVMVMGDQGNYSYNYSNAAAKTGTITAIATERSARTLFNRIFVPGTSGPPPAMARTPIIDRVLENYRRLRNSDRRLSMQDRQRLDDHVSRLNELERKVNLNAPPPPRSCSGVSAVIGDSGSILNGAGTGRVAAFQLYNDVIAAAFICDTNRVATVSCGDPLISYSGSWHQEIAHQWSGAGPQRSLQQHYQIFFERIFLDLATKLDVDEGNGTTILDNTLAQWTQESGQQTHDNAQCPVITFGGAGGFFKTGILADYRKLNSFYGGEAQGADRLTLGVTYNRWLATALQAMGLPPSEWERPGEKGYANPMVGDGYRPHYSNAVLLSSASQVAPFTAA